MKPVILIYSHFAPWPLSIGSAQRIHQMYAELQGSYQLVLYCGNGGIDTSEGKHPFDRVYKCGFLICRLTKWLKSQSVATVIVRLMQVLSKVVFRIAAPSPIPGERWPKTITSNLRQLELLILAFKYKPGVMICEYVWSVPDALPASLLMKRPLVIDTHDILHERESAQLEKGLENSWHGIDREAEIALWRRSKIVIAIQSKEKATIQSLSPGNHVVLAEHGIEVDTPVRGIDAEPGRVLCVASSAQPNVHGLEIFISEHWSKVLQCFPTAELHIVGNVCSALKKSSLDLDRVVLHGVVPDLSKCYREAHIVINPVDYGSGLKIKTVEAIAHGKCLLSTPIGGQGLEEHFGSAFHVVPTGSFGEALVSLLESPNLVSNYESSARRLYLSRFAPASCYAELKLALAECTKGGT